MALGSSLPPAAIAGSHLIPTGMIRRLSRKAGFTRRFLPPDEGGLSKSGRQDLNLRPRGPKPRALARLSYAPRHNLPSYRQRRRAQTGTSGRELTRGHSPVATRPGHGAKQGSATWPGAARKKGAGDTARAHRRPAPRPPILDPGIGPGRAAQRWFRGRAEASYIRAGGHQLPGPPTRTPPRLSPRAEQRPAGLSRSVAGRDTGCRRPTQAATRRLPASPAKPPNRESSC